ncbi:zinc-finger homeodomain protein 2-like [Diospyros lotus]|uniref:zinc-finger homeodomain protein 2-like n=1 Tax=Diospyros lotus TaxID=55363 RepID=UPI00225C0BC1|nr:zinc-finger homeodomain protein 2-like [Diospyros lotus]
MEIERHENQEEGIRDPVNVTKWTTPAANKGGGGSGGRGTSWYRECMKNHAASMGGHAVDGCNEFFPAGEEGTLDAHKCAACHCHRNFHRKEVSGESFRSHHYLLHHQQRPPYYHPVLPSGSGYLNQVTMPRPYQQLLALPSTSREEEGGANPGGGGPKKRSRTKFSQEQKEKMLVLAKSLGWRIQKHDAAAVEQFCSENGVERRVLKVWMHNNKHASTVARKLSSSMAVPLEN